MGTKHTPGPWTATDDAVTEGRGLTVADVDGGSPAERRANARAIAAVPAMIGALRDLVEDFGAMTGGCESLDVARAILKHIEGGA